MRKDRTKQVQQLILSALGAAQSAQIAPRPMTTQPAPSAPVIEPHTDINSVIPEGPSSAVLQNAVQKLIAASGGKISISSGKRSTDRQAQLWNEALKKYGSPEKARKWVAPPGHSKHERGEAFDLKFADPATRAWAHQNAAQYGIQFPLSNEYWHAELIGSRKKK